MMQIVKEILEKTFNKKLCLAHADAVKFLLVLNPEENNTVSIEIKYSVLNEGNIRADAVISGNNTQYFKMKALYK